jgi:hypothetical protein
MNWVVASSNFEASRNRFVLSAPQRTLVRADQNHRALAHLARLHEGMAVVGGIAGQVAHELAGHGGKGSEIEGALLRLEHLRRRDHLHGLGDLGRALDRFDAAADVPGARHD